MANYVRNEDDSIDILIRIVKDSNPEDGCSECSLKKQCKSRQFKDTDCFISSLFGLIKESNNCHIEIIV